MDDYKKGAWMPEEVGPIGAGAASLTGCVAPSKSTACGLPLAACRSQRHNINYQDLLLKRLVDQLGPARWSIVAERIPGRSGKSCRLRWASALASSLL
jgi:hypothetical protein